MWYTKAAEQGDARAQYSLGTTYDSDGALGHSGRIRVQSDDKVAELKVLEKIIERW